MKASSDFASRLTSEGFQAKPAPASPSVSAVRYWRTVCALVMSHVLGRTWPPPGEPQRTRVVGHWGCNPGIAWAVGHLASCWQHDQPFQLVVGTGHAASFLFGHQAASVRLDPASISAATARYGDVGGTPSELLGLPGIPYSGGELGPALGVSQGLAAHLGHEQLVVCVIGDGECETPAALAAFAHAGVLLRPSAAWLPVVNANGARMGGPSRFGPEALAGLLRGLGYEVVVSGDQEEEASTAARAALDRCLAGVRCAWLSVTEKGWPVPPGLGGRPYRGHLAHKAPLSAHGEGLPPADLDKWFGVVRPNDLLLPGGVLPDDVVQIARRANLQVALPPRRSHVDDADSRSSTPSLAEVGWDRPIARVDEILVRRRPVVYSPDEASSNGLTGCLAAGLVIEVLAEDLCAAWTWGTVEAGKPAVMATYEAFAPLAATTIAQYAKMAQERPRQEAPPFLVLSTSLGWANTPTHQNTDLSGVLLARSQLRPDVVYPVGARSAAYRFGRLMDERSDGVGMMVCSKQWLLDLPDSGSPATAYHVRGAGDPAAVLVVVCDVCATEAVAAAALAAGVGTAVEVIALVDLVRAPAALRGEAGRLSALPVLAAAWCAPRYVQPLVWEALGRPIPVQGYVERWAATPWETLQANRLDRGSLLEGLAAAGMPLPDGFLAAVAAELRGRLNAASDLSGVLPFDPPVLQVTAIGD